MVETLAEIKEDIAEKDYDSARKKTTETIASLFFSSSTKPTFSTDSPFLRKIASTSDPRELTTLLSSALELVDIYSKLHRYSVPVSDPWSPDIVLEELQAFFPGHLAARSAIELIHRTPETVDFIHAYGHYGNPEFKSYDEGNLEGRVSGLLIQ